MPSQTKFRREKVKVGEIRRLAGLMCTMREAAGVFGITEKTFKDMLKYDEAAKRAWEEGQQDGKVSLRRKQFRLADSSAPMAIFLGRQYLNQADITVVEHSGINGHPIDIDVSGLSNEERKALRSLMQKMRKGQ